MNNVMLLINNMTIYCRNDGRLEGRITINGKRKSFFGHTKAEIKNKAKTYLLKIENGYKEPQKIKLADYIEYWLKTYKLNKIEPTSYSRMYTVYRCQIKNTLGQKLIGTITTKDIQNLINEHANPSNNKVTPLAISGLKKILQLLKPCFNTAMREGIIQSNPCDDVFIPTESCVFKETKKQFSLTDDEILRFKIATLAKLKTSNEYKSRTSLILLLILNLGLRAGEAIALVWEDVDIDKKLIYINKTVQSGIVECESDKIIRRYSRIKKSTKTSAGTRVLYLNDFVLWILNELKQYDTRNDIVSDYVCCTNTGTIHSPRNLQRKLDTIVKEAKIDKQVSLHTLRHTFGSTLLRHGVNISVISKLMGHANISVTYNKYIHTIQEEQAKAMNVQIC